MSNADIAVDVLAAAAAGLVSLIPAVGTLMTPAVIAAIKAGALAIADYTDKKIDATTLMAAIASNDAAEVQRNTDAAAYEQGLLGATPTKTPA